MALTLPLLTLGTAIGVLAGVGGVTFFYANGASYMTDNPEACVNCHVMRDQYQGWERSSHRSVAVCNDCHTPHNIVGKYMTKAINGLSHSYWFTVGGFKDPIHITARSRRVTEGTCRECHGELSALIESLDHAPVNQTQCTSCHRDVGHSH